MTQMTGKALVAYFSATGTTAGRAKKIADAVGADVYEIRPAQPYTDKDLDWHDSGSRTTIEKNDASCRPAMEGDAPDLSGYDTVFIGFPVWWYKEPNIVDTFMDAVDLDGKKVAVFATSGGTGVDGCVDHMRKLHPEAVWLKGKLVNSGDPAQWAKESVGE